VVYTLVQPLRIIPIVVGGPPFWASSRVFWLVNTLRRKIGLEDITALTVFGGDLCNGRVFGRLFNSEHCLRHISVSDRQVNHSTLHDTLYLRSNATCRFQLCSVSLVEKAMLKAERKWKHNPTLFPHAHIYKGNTLGHWNRRCDQDKSTLRIECIQSLAPSLSPYPQMHPIRHPPCLSIPVSRFERLKVESIYIKLLIRSRI
jgi:hypothetical protein